METLPAPPPEFVAAADLLGTSEPDGAWRREARPEQLPPEGDWFIWLLLAGRGFGKTWVGARELTPAGVGINQCAMQAARFPQVPGRLHVLSASGGATQRKDPT
jgi:phage terminase large subunit-like protein